ncbi:pimeloyl-ACP methyl ester carboxylesterase [Streptosporangium album]|uniref:Pimeloyl-ACP methyl ester carboxylesterase n=1 Tax=Streptosporangium album TaxID=47479 RepID=A0A7W7S0T8_9ACTN|nr:alpha/beta hydrolase [Streptosporangium album]MBB4941830.1 pimeloyl-ACP methyl ester carboxylesterase [Streptosporangium album]
MHARSALPRRMVLAVAAGGLAAALLTVPSASAAAAHDEASATAKPTIVLVHGGFADASGWNGVIPRLQEKGYPVVAPANPLRGLPTDAPYIASVLKSIEGPIVLVGHSYGGAVITNAAVGISNVKALVYVAGMVPDEGETLAELFAKYPTSQIPDSIREVPFTNADGSTGIDLYLKPDKFRSTFAADLPASTTRLMQAGQRPFAASSYTDKTKGAAWRTIPSWAVMSTQDKAIPPALQRFFFKRARARITEVATSHVPMISQPSVVTRVIQEAARAVD